MSPPRLPQPNRASLRFGLLAAFVMLWVFSTRMTGSEAKADAIVAADGSGDFTSLQDAISAAPMKTAPDAPRWVIHVKPGTYRERVYVQRERGHIRVVGDDATTTTLAYDLNATMPGPDGKPIGTFRTPTLQIDGDGMIWENMTISNTAGPVGQALALRADGDQLVFRNCRFLGWQDTLLLNRGRHLFENCYVEGHVDFIFGAATAFFDRCEIHVLRDGYITAASTPKNQSYGFVFVDCRITGVAGTKTFLGRPWREFAKTVFIRTEMADVIQPAGWHNWNKPDAEQTTYYAECGSVGPGSRPTGRAPWAKSLTAEDLSTYSVEKVLGDPERPPTPGSRIQAMPSTPKSPPIVLVGDSTVAEPSRWGSRLLRDIPYGEAAGEKLLLDAHVPDGDGPFPIAILVHGGGWSRGDKSGLDEPTKGADVTPWFGPLTEAKFTWFSINYRHAPKNRWPACFEDVQSAIRWVKTHAAEYKGDPSRIALFGHSAGGHLVCLAATRAGDDTRVHAIVGYAPVTDFEQELPVRGGLSPSLQQLHGRPKEITPESLVLLRETSPINHVKPGLPPFLLIHGDADKTVPYQQSLNFQQKLRAHGVTCDLLTIPAGQHGLLGWSQIAPDYSSKMIAWLRNTLGDVDRTSLSK